MFLISSYFFLLVQVEQVWKLWDVHSIASASRKLDSYACNCTRNYTNSASSENGAFSFIQELKVKMGIQI